MKNLIRKVLVKLYAFAKNAHQQERYNGYRKRYRLDKTFRFNGDNVMFYGDGQLTIGKNSYIGSYSTLQLAKGCEIRIGDNCRISHNVRLYTSSAKPDQDFSSYNALESKSGNIVIGDAVWIGVNVFIGPGINIGKNVIVGANAVVTSDIPANAIVGGIPAKVIRFKKDA